MRAPLLSLSVIAFLNAAVDAADREAIAIQTMTAQMRYDVSEFSVRPGAEVELTFQNNDDLPHNLVICQPGTDTAAMAMKQMEKPEEALKRNWLPDDPRILAHSSMLNPHQSEKVRFTAPMKPGQYPFVCTFPGHALTMRGQMKVFPLGGTLTDLKFSLYLGNWKQLPDFSKLTPHRQGDVPDNLIQLKLDDYKNEFGVVFTGKLMAPADGSYRFYLASDDGARIAIDGAEVVESDGIHPASSIKEGATKLTKGVHEFRLEYFQAAGQQELYAAWKGAGFDVTPLSKWVHPGIKAGPKKKAADTTGMPLAVSKEAVIYRNFITDAGTRGIGVGYPGGFNIAWSAQTMNLALLWRGAFIDAARHWNGRGGGAQSPLGYDVVRPAGGVGIPLAILDKPETGWPAFDARKDQLADGFVFKGYELDPSTRAPTFRYTWQGLQISDRFVPEGLGTAPEGRLHRLIEFKGTVPAHTWLRLAEGTIASEKDGTFMIDAGRATMDGREFPNRIRIAAAGATASGKNLLLPVHAGEVRITYSWP